jgi:stage V sporulation protein R
MNLSPELEAARREIRGHAVAFGLDFFEVIYEVLNYEEMNAIAAYGGFPVRYPHWRWGMEYEHLSKSYAFGLHKIYEMVINNSPSYAYLLEANPLVDQKLVMAHVYGHSDFFKNNAWFSHTNRKMMDQMANHATKVRRLIDRHGLERVENFIDACLSIEGLIDPHSVHIVRDRPEPPGGETAPPAAPRLKSKDYMRDFINPPEILAAEERRLREAKEKQKGFPAEPRRDVLQFLLEHAPLEPWEGEILAIIREESYYFAPQAQTKIMNEGWAAYWHSRIMTERALRDSEVIDYADHHSGTLGGGSRRLNPYKLGIELYRDIEERWDKGRFGKDYDDCTDVREREHWDLKLHQGRQKIFEARRVHNDVTFIDSYLTPEFCRRHKLFTYEYNQKTGAYHIADREFAEVKRKLLFQITNLGQPFIDVEDGNYQNRGELYLRHRHEGIDLKHDYARETLRNMQLLWKRPVNIESVVEGSPKVLRFDGQDFDERTPEPAAAD